MFIRCTLRVFSLTVLLLIGSAQAAGPSDTFTYQALVSQSGTPVNGTVNITVGVWDALTGGSELDNNTFLGHAISDGLLKVDLMFAPGTFDGSDRWLQIEINGAPLSPRQPVLPAPYAMFAGTSETVNSVPDGALPAAYTSAVDFSNGSNQFSGDGSGLTALDASSLTSGIVPEARLSSNVALLNSSPTFTGSSLTVDGFTSGALTTISSSFGGVYFADDTTIVQGSVSYAHGARELRMGNRLAGTGTIHNIVLEDDGTTTFPGKVGIGTVTPSATLHIDGSSSSDTSLQIDAPGSATGSFFFGSPAGSVGMTANANNGNRRDVRFTDSGIGLWTSATGSMPVAGNGLFINEDGEVGIGTTTPWQKLHVIGRGRFEYGSEAVWGISNSNNGSVSGVFGETSGTFGWSTGVRGEATSSTGFVHGVRGESDGDTGAGVVGRAMHSSGANYGVYASTLSPNGYGVYSVGDVQVNGTLSKSGGAFRIDHPLDPENKELWHSFVESPDMMNIYNGNVTTDGDGYATVTMPEWFDALNRDFRYQLTVIDEADSDSFTFAKIVREISGNTFTVRTSEPWTKVSWQVTGIRQDPWAEANRIPSEVEKREEDKGYYLSPEAYGLPRERGVDRRAMAPRVEALEAARNDHAMPDLREDRP